MDVSNAIYLDHAATTPPLPEALERLNRLNSEVFGNSASVHAIGRRAAASLEQSQDAVSRVFNVPPSHVIFTSGGTESNNLAIWGALGGLSQGIQWLKSESEGQIITSVNEHDATKKPIECLESLGANVAWIGVDREGFLDLAALENALLKRTKLLTIHHVQSEIGTVQNLRAISDLARARSPSALIHTDAAQSFLKMPLDPAELGVDLLSISGHKIGAPKGIGALILGKRFENRKPRIEPFLQGSSQQGGSRPGTVPVPLIGSLAAAIEWGNENLARNRERLTALQRHLLQGLPERAVLNGPKADDGGRAPQTVNFSIPGFPSGMMVEALAERGICVSAGSACHSTSPKPNETVENLGVGGERALSALRVSLSPMTTTEAIDAFLSILSETIRQYS
ncbi:MAG: cysteine desulfurase [Deltaproteobacteria bacterium]|nr:cysteine desulfurase [Deltaproteobacteria bacterium]